MTGQLADETTVRNDCQPINVKFADQNAKTPADCRGLSVSTGCASLAQGFGAAFRPIEKNGFDAKSAAAPQLSCAPNTGVKLFANANMALLIAEVKICSTKGQAIEVGKHRLLLKSASVWTFHSRSPFLRVSVPETLHCCPRNSHLCCNPIRSPTLSKKVA